LRVTWTPLQSLGHGVDFLYKPKGKIILLAHSCVRSPVVKLVVLMQHVLGSISGRRIFLSCLPPDYLVKAQNIQHVAKREGSCQPSPRAVFAPFFYLYLFIFTSRKYRRIQYKYLVPHLVTQIELLFDCLGSIPMFSRFFVLKNIFNFTICTTYMQQKCKIIWFKIMYESAFGFHSFCNHIFYFLH
jgi:hypothetical protein